MRKVRTSPKKLTVLPVEKFTRCITFGPGSVIWSSNPRLEKAAESIGYGFVRLQPSATLDDARLEYVTAKFRFHGAHVVVGARTREARADVVESDPGITPQSMADARDVVTEMVSAWKGGDVGALTVETEDIMSGAGL